MAKQICPRTCGADDFDHIIPAPGRVDARQPHDPFDPEANMGIDHVGFRGDYGLNIPCCMELSESPQQGEPIRIADIVHVPLSDDLMVLNRPITPGAYTLFTYADSQEPSVIMRHPANVNADAVADGADVLELIAVLDLTAARNAFDTYLCDMNFDDACGPEDLLRLIDLLNGGETFDSWWGTPLPQP